MANTLGQMQTEIWAWTDTDSTRVPAAYITRIVNGIIADLSRSADLLYNEYTEEYGIYAGINEYIIEDELVNKFSRPFSMWYTNSSGARIRIEYLPPEAFEKKFQNSTDQAAPTYYTIFGENIVLGDIPDAVYTGTFKYYGYPADLEDSTDTNSFLKSAWDVIQYGVLGEVCKFLIEDQRVAMFVPEYEKRRRRFLIEHARAKSSGSRLISHEPGWLE